MPEREDNYTLRPNSCSNLEKYIYILKLRFANVSFHRTSAMVIAVTRLVAQRLLALSRRRRKKEKETPVTKYLTAGWLRHAVALMVPISRAPGMQREACTRVYARRSESVRRHASAVNASLHLTRVIRDSAVHGVVESSRRYVVPLTEHHPAPPPPSRNPRPVHANKPTLILSPFPEFPRFFTNDQFSTDYQVARSKNSREAGGIF